MRTVTVRFTGGPAAGLLRDLPVEPDGRPPARWIMTHPEPAGPDTAATAPADAGRDHLYERARLDGHGVWTMRFVRSDPLGVTE